MASANDPSRECLRCGYTVRPFDAWLPNPDAPDMEPRPSPYCRECTREHLAERAELATRGYQPRKNRIRTEYGKRRLAAILAARAQVRLAA